MLERKIKQDKGNRVCQEWIGWKQGWFLYKVTRESLWYDILAETWSKWGHKLRGYLGISFCLLPQIHSTLPPHPLPLLCRCAQEVGLHWQAPLPYGFWLCWAMRSMGRGWQRGKRMRSAYLVPSYRTAWAVSLDLRSHLLSGAFST